ncbi:pyruvate kinase, barrel domain protein, partial [Vibrio parahaemolyticus V-223/04]
SRRKTKLTSSQPQK